MKTKTILICLLVLILSSCNYDAGFDGKTPEQRQNEDNQKYNCRTVDFNSNESMTQVNTVVIDSCEYLYNTY